MVFIDPISFSILKKIHLKYSDFEIPRAVKDSMLSLKQVMQGIFAKHSQLTIKDLFQSVLRKNRDHEEIVLRDFVTRVSLLDNTMPEAELWKVCRVLDQDGNGKLSYEEFLHLLEVVGSESNSLNSQNETEELYDTLWPEWVLTEGVLEQAKELIGRMFDHLEQTEGIPPEAAFGLYDSKDKGYTREDHFRQILRRFFGEVLQKQDDIDFVIRLAPKNYFDSTIDYRAFCRFMEKKFVRTFRAASFETSIK